MQNKVSHEKLLKLKSWRLKTIVVSHEKLFKLKSWKFEKNCAKNSKPKE